jgi:hypothetical protein
MPAGKKQCPACQKEWGTRKKICGCGHEFIGHPLAPEPGAWVLDNVKGMPVMSPPPDLPEGKASTTEIRDWHVAYEGLGFCIYDYIPAEKIEDPKLRTLWKKARQAMQDVVEHMENK